MGSVPVGEQNLDLGAIEARIKEAQEAWARGEAVRAWMRRESLPVLDNDAAVAKALADDVRLLLAALAEARGGS